MSRGARPAARGSLIASVLVACSMALGCPDGPSAAAGPSVRVGDDLVAVEIARTPAEQSLGLGNRDSLEWGRGMLFVYDETGFLSFWMKRMRFDIDIVWIRKERVVGISAFVPYPRENPDRPATVRSPELVDTVLEVPAGYAQAHGWRRGDRVRFEGLDTAS
jgi:uncharacterized membrane protein (UPF0127 family)